MHADIGRIIDRLDLEAHLAAPAAAILACGGGVEDIDLDIEGHLAAEVLPGHEHQILERRRILHHQAVGRLAVAIEEMAVLGIDGQGHRLHRLQTTVGHRGADVRQLDREIEVDLGVFQVVRLAVAIHILDLQLQLGQAIGTAVDVDLGGDGEGNLLLHHLGIPAHRVGVDQPHVEVQVVAGIVLWQGEG
ncbi:hypothetical protein D3C76_1123220 [compost metagenome]